MVDKESDSVVQVLAWAVETRGWLASKIPSADREPEDAAPLTVEDVQGLMGDLGNVAEHLAGYLRAAPSMPADNVVDLGSERKRRRSLAVIACTDGNAA